MKIIKDMQLKILMNSAVHFVIFILLPFLGNAQVQVIGHWWPEDTTDVHILTTVRSDEFLGRLLQNDSNSVVFLLKSGDTLAYDTKSVLSVQILHEKPVTKSDIISERLLIAPTGFGLEKGENEYRNIMFLYNSYHHGITDKITVGVTLIPTFFVNIGTVDAKFSLKLHEHIYLSAGGLVGGGLIYNFPEEADEETFIKNAHLGYFGAITIGSKERFINLSTAQVHYFEKGDFDTNFMIYSLGASYKIGKGNRLFLEAGNSVGSPAAWNVGMGISTLFKRNSFDAGMLFFPGRRPRMLPAFAFAKRF